MRKPVSVRRQKKNKQYIAPVNPVIEEVLKSTELNTEIDTYQQKSQSIQTGENVLLEKIDMLLLEQQHTKMYLAETEKTQKELKNLIIALEKEVGMLKHAQLSVSDLLQKILSRVGNITLLSDIHADIKALKSIGRDDYKTILSILLDKKQDQDTERTISFQLGKTLIDSTKNVNDIIGLPKKLLNLRKESLHRKHKSSFVEGVTIEHKPAIRKIGVKKLTLDQILDKNQNKFDGNLLNTLVLKNHELVSFCQNQNGLQVISKMPIEKPRYFYSSKMIDLSSISNYCKNNKLSLLLNTEEAGLHLELIVSYLNNKKEKISFSVVKPLSKIFLNIPDGCEYLNLGAKISGNGEFFIREIQLQGFHTSKNNEKNQIKLNHGISIVIPSYNGASTIGDTLKSIKAQKGIDLNIVEVICVINGPVKQTEKIINGFIKNNPEVNLKMLYSDIASASQARNIGLENATKEFLVFLDDDDLISENYLSNMYALSDQNTVVFSYIHDLDSQGLVTKETNITQQLIKNKDNLNLNGLSSAITMIASKMLPTADVRQIKFDPMLKSGEDVSFFVEYMVKFNPKFKLVADTNCAYVRRITENSVSRQPMSFNFNVEQRLDVIKALDSLILSNKDNLDNFIISKMKAQVGFIVRYLLEQPQDLQLVLEKIVQRKIYNFPYKFFWEKIGKSEVKQLVFSYCHPPFVDTSATIVGKRIQEFGLLSDIIANDMSSLRKVDQEMMFLSKHLINDTIFLQTETSFGGWRAIKEFSEQANQTVDGKLYTQIYSRVLWPGSNFAAAMYKLKNSQTKWIAEFSDPVVLDIKGEERNSLLDDAEWIKGVLSHLPLHFQQLLANENNLYVWCELIAYLFSDEIIFTCENQRKVMLGKFKYQDIAQLAYNKSVIKQHPTLPEVFYNLGQNQYEIDHDFINIGYFGVFYENRNLNDFITAVNDVNKQKNVKRKIKLHIFTNNPQEFSGKYGEYIIFNGYLGYFDFLSTSNSFDYLLVNDAVVSNIFGINPYLPSKVSDYKGAQAEIIALVESGSALSKMEGIPIKLFLGSEHSFSTKLLSLVDNEAV